MSLTSTEEIKTTVSVSFAEILNLLSMKEYRHMLKYIENYKFLNINSKH